MAITSTRLNGDRLGVSGCSHSIVTWPQPLEAIPSWPHRESQVPSPTLSAVGSPAHMGRTHPQPWAQVTGPQVLLFAVTQGGWGQEVVRGSLC